MSEQLGTAWPGVSTESGADAVLTHCVPQLFPGDHSGLYFVCMFLFFFNIIYLMHYPALYLFLFILLLCVFVCVSCTYVCAPPEYSGSQRPEGGTGHLIP